MGLYSNKYWRSVAEDNFIGLVMEIPRGISSRVPQFVSDLNSALPLNFDSSDLKLDTLDTTRCLFGALRYQYERFR